MNQMPPVLGARVSQVQKPAAKPAPPAMPKPVVQPVKQAETVEEMVLEDLDFEIVEPEVVPEVSEPAVSKRKEEYWKESRIVKADVLREASDKRAVPRSKKVQVSRKCAEAGTSVIRNIPKEVIGHMRAEFPTEDPNLLDLFMAYTYVHASGEMQEAMDALLSSAQKGLLSHYQGRKTEEIKKRLDRMDHTLDRLEKLCVTSELVGGYLLFDRLGFRNDMAQTPVDVNFREDGVTDLMKVARMQSGAYKKEIDWMEQTPAK